MFTHAERRYLTNEDPEGRRLGRLATVGKDGTPHVVPVGWQLDIERGVVVIRGMNFARTKKFRDVRRSGRAAIVVDDVLPPWRPRGVEIRGSAEAIDDGDPRIEIHPERIIGWGLDSTELGKQNARDVSSVHAR